MRRPTVLVSGAGVAGAVVAHWLAHRGFDVTVVERAAALRRTGGHAVDLTGRAIEVVERMGVLPSVRDARVRRDRLTLVRPGRTPLRTTRLLGAVDPRWVEIQRDDLIEILHGATRELAEHRFGDSISALEQTGGGVEVSFERAPAARFDLVVGADGLHSRTRRLAFGPESGYRHDLGAHLAVFSYPNELGLDGEVVGHVDVDRTVFTYPVADGVQARALLLYRTAQAADRDPGRQRQLLRRAFGDAGWETPRLLAHVDAAEDFYADSISQIRMAEWTRGRVALVGDAGFSPGPAVGGGTGLAVVSGYVLANELAAAGGEHTAAFRAYHDALRGPVAQSRKLGPGALKQLVPTNRAGVWMTVRALQLAGRLPARLLRALSSLQGADRQTLDDLASVPTAGAGYRTRASRNPS